ncbi:hypothetical protein [Bradyrhizobium sp. Leaf396]|jgi:anti-sigma factor RsiW|uniref:anti-sigma factor family protein n=2 Tax=Bradyrhizobium TaxID=374 RepID=UPI000AC01B4D|nr:hypothetical protein [Bradyrhizobium sp. Leaf396]
MMTERNIPVTEDELHAYVDNELSAKRREAVRAWLASHPCDAERVCAWRALGAELHRRYGGVASEPVPHRLALDHLVEPRLHSRIGPVAAALLAFIIGTSAGWAIHQACAVEVSSIEGLPLSAMRT